LNATTAVFFGEVVRWQARHGRHQLPWQNTRDPYRVWLSEIMLQQTQVTTVVDYFARFLNQFPDVQSLAAAPLDEVLGLWSGLGYYSRARNLHASAQALVLHHGGEFPKKAAQLEQLPGIGRSTAAAITSLCFGERVAILDGNVKRVLTRALGFAGDLAQNRQVNALWQQAQALVPDEATPPEMARYTQGMMDLGATVCTAREPQCERCPLARLCVAREHATHANYPVKTRKLKRSAQSLWMLWAQSGEGQLLLQQRPTPGVWAGLYCFPLFDSALELEAAIAPAIRQSLQFHAPFKHVLTHKDLHLHAVQLSAPAEVLAGLMGLEGRWFTPSQWPKLGLPAPVRKLLQGALPEVAPKTDSGG
jgi:A/G-specific adenine glycosylase